MTNRSFLALLIGGSAAVFGGVFTLAGTPKAEAVGRKVAAAMPVYYPGCNAARAAGASPLYRGQPGYRAAMDGDGDGIACEPYRGSGGQGSGFYRSRRKRR